MEDDWHFIAMSMDATTVRIYVDGKLHRERLRGTDEKPHEGSIALASSARHPRFYLDELRVYERPVLQDEIKRLMKLRSRKDQ